MKFNITPSVAERKPTDELYKNYFKLLAIQFNDVSTIKQAKLFYRKNAKMIGVVIPSEAMWSISDEDESVCVQLSVMQDIPKHLTSIVLDGFTLHYDFVRYRVKDAAEIKAFESKLTTDLI